jgi:hypothetical protein
MILKRFAIAVLLCACGPEYAVVPKGGVPYAQANVKGAQLTAFADQWNADPGNLADFITPIALDLYNNSGTDIRISYVDFALRDETGFRYTAVNPFVAYGAAASAHYESSNFHASFEPDFQRGDLLAHGGGGGGGGGHGGGGGGGGGHGGGGHGGGGGGHAVAHGGGGFHGGGWHGGYGGWHQGIGRGFGGHGFHPSPWLRRYYGGAFAYWDGALFYPDGYWDYVQWWGPRYYPYQPSEDVLQFAIPEGALQPGGHIGGFLYFQNATARGAHVLDLTWEVYDAHTNVHIGTNHVKLQVIKLTQNEGAPRYELRVVASK